MPGDNDKWKPRQLVLHKQKYFHSALDYFYYCKERTCCRNYDIYVASIKRKSMLNKAKELHQCKLQSKAGFPLG